jgi:putative restriction endonuclease
VPCSAGAWGGGGGGGWGNTSAADRAVWEEYYGRWDLLADNAVVPEQFVVAESATRSQGPARTPPGGPTEIVREVAQRRGQSFFRASVFAAHEGKCCITGIANEALLRASHIVPWSRDPTLRLDPRNGLCLNALHDAAFDRGLITLSERFELRISHRLKSEVPESVYKEMFESRANSTIVIPERFRPSPAMLEFHRCEVFVA